MQHVFARVINLEDRKDRWKHMQPILQRNTKLDIQRFNAIRLSEHEAVAKLSRYARNEFKKERKDYAAIRGVGAVSCFVSHYSVWKDFLESDKLFCLVLEDDLDPATDLQTQVENLLKDQHWEIGLLGWMPAPIKLDNAGYVISYPQIEGYFGAHAYLLTRKAASKLVKNAFPLEMQVDYYMQSIASEFGLRIRPAAERAKQCWTGGSDVFTLCILCNQQYIYIAVLFLLLILLVTRL